MGIRLKAASAALIAGAAVAVPVATAGPAAAATDYGINMTQACRYTYNGSQYWADFNNYYSPFSWICWQNTYTVGFPSGVSVTVSPVGGVDVQKYCTITYPGSRAVVVAWNAYGWRCRR
jgi:hypothetical protein